MAKKNRFTPSNDNDKHQKQKWFQQFEYQKLNEGREK